MTTQTTSEKVHQAVANGYQLLAQLNEKREELKKAKASEDTARAASPVEELTATVAATRDSAKEGAKAAYEAAIAEASLNRDKAEGTYRKMMEHAQTQKHDTDATADAAYEKDAGSLLREHEMVMVEAKAGVHTASREVVAQEDIIRQNRKVVRDTLGIDLGNLIGD